MKVLFIYPNIAEHGDVPIALTVLTSVLRRGGHSVTVFDCSWYVPEINLQTTKEDFGMFKVAPPAPVPPPHRKEIKDLERDLSNAVREFDADIVGITATSGTFPVGLKCSKFIKKHCPDVLIIFGGIHPTVCPEEVLSEDSVDVICIGEGEDALLELCESMEAQRPIYEIKNLWVKDRGDLSLVHKNPLRPLKDLNTIPLQDFSDFHEYEFYRPLDGKIYRMLNTEISRGCIFKCHYCSNHFLRDLFKGLGTYHRQKDPSIAVRQIKELKERYGFNCVRFWDEDFTAFPIRYLKELCELYKKEVGLPFLVYAGTRTVTEEKAACLKEMGCITLAMAIESGNYWMRKYVLNRDISDEDIINKYEIVKKNGIRVSAYNMIGLPFETREMIFDTIYLNRKVRPATSSVAAYIPYPKTRLAEIAKEFGLSNGPVDYCNVRTSIESPHLTIEGIDGLIRTFSLYTKLPEEFFPILAECEKDESLSSLIFPILIKYLDAQN